MEVVLSVITPTFNRYALLKDNIRSILEQSENVLEHVIIDNLSTDGTESLVSDYAREAPYPVHYIRERDSGIYNAMNKGIKASHGRWLIFLGSDDRFASDRVVRDTFCSSKSIADYDLIVGGVFYGDSLQSAQYHAPYYDAKLRYHAFHHQGTFIRASMFERYGLYSERYKIAADGVFNARYYHRARYLLLDYPVAWQLPGGASSGLSVRNMCEYCLTAVVYRKFPVEMKLGYVKDFLMTLVKEGTHALLRIAIVRNTAKKLLRRLKRLV